MTRALLVALTLAAACGPPKGKPLTGTDFEPDVDLTDRVSGGDSVPVWADKMSARVRLIEGRDLPPAVVKALVDLLPPPEALAPNRLLWARPLADDAGLLAFAAERTPTRQTGEREGVLTYVLATRSGAGFTLVASVDEPWTGSGAQHRELDARDVDGDGTVDLIVDSDRRSGDRGQLGLAVFFSGSRTIGRATYASRDGVADLAPDYACVGELGDTPAIVVVTRTVASADGTLIGDRFANVWLPDDKGRFTPTVVWGHVIGAAAEPGLLASAWRKATGSKAPPDAQVDEDGRLTAVPDCGAGVPLIVGAVFDADGKIIRDKPYHLVGGLHIDRAAAEAVARGKLLVMLKIAELN